MEMARRRRSTLPELPRDCQGITLEEAWAYYLEVFRKPSSFQVDPHTFAPRVFVRPNLWRIPDPQDPEAFLDHFERGLLTYQSLSTRLNLMREAFPSSPQRPPRYSIRFDSPRGLAIHGFCIPEAAKAFIDRVIAHTAYRWVNDRAIQSNDITISSNELEDIMETTTHFSLPSPYPSLVAQIRGEALEPANSEPAPALAPRPKGSTGKQSNGVSELASLLGLNPSATRARLRKSGMAKPAAGWAWTSDELQLIAKRLKA